MNIIQPSAKIIKTEPGLDILRRIAKSATVCYAKSTETWDDERVAMFVHGLIHNEHLSPLEHGSMTVQFTCDRAIANELTRHRLAAFTQESTRYVKYDENIDYIGERAMELMCDPATMDVSRNELAKILAEWLLACEDAENHYRKLLLLGASTQFARSVLNLSTACNLVMTANLREWRHVFELRAAETTGKVHPAMKYLMLDLLSDADEYIPVVFSDIQKKVSGEDIKEESK